VESTSLVRRHHFLPLPFQYLHCYISEFRCCLWIQGHLRCSTEPSLFFEAVLNPLFSSPWILASLEEHVLGQRLSGLAGTVRQICNSQRQCWQQWASHESRLCCSDRHWSSVRIGSAQIPPAPWAANAGGIHCKLVLSV